LDELTSRLGRTLDDSWFLAPTHKGWMPAVNVEEKKDEVVLTAELPGLGHDDVEIELENNILTIRGEKREEREEGDDDSRYHLWERRYGSFQRSFTVPRTVKPTDINAVFENGILTVHMPKVPEAKGRKISIGKKA
jgi:HSP20 family protein